MTMSYHVGSLSALLSSPASDAVNDVTTKDGGLKGLFESRSTLPKPSLQQEPEGMIPQCSCSLLKHNQVKTSR